jgi:hypothetical protein
MVLPKGGSAVSMDERPWQEKAPLTGQVKPDQLVHERGLKRAKMRHFKAPFHSQNTKRKRPNESQESPYTVGQMASQAPTTSTR